MFVGKHTHKLSFRGLGQPTYIMETKSGPRLTYNILAACKSSDDPLGSLWARVHRKGFKFKGVPVGFEGSCSSRVITSKWTPCLSSPFERPELRKCAYWKNFKPSLDKNLLPICYLTVGRYSNKLVVKPDFVEAWRLFVVEVQIFEGALLKALEAKFSWIWLSQKDKC